jgi:hypothetical protein
MARPRITESACRVRPRCFLLAPAAKSESFVWRINKMMMDIATAVDPVLGRAGLRFELRALQDYVKCHGNTGPVRPGQPLGVEPLPFYSARHRDRKSQRRDYYDYIREHAYTPSGIAPAWLGARRSGGKLAGSDTRK